MPAYVSIGFLHGLSCKAFMNSLEGPEEPDMIADPDGYNTKLF